jgi:cytochrome c-type biogenesis protein CcmH
MVLWFAFAVLTAGATLAVLWPLAKARRAAPAAVDAHDLAVYRDQLEELERDRERGLIGASEAEAARTEIARRALKAGEAAAAAPSGGRTLARPVALAAVIVVPLGALGLYGTLGSPDLPALPLEQRLANASEDDVPAMIARVERHLAANPGDEQGWRVLAPIYARMGRFEDAAEAWRKIATLSGPTPEINENMGEMLVAAADGVVEAPALAAFEDAIAEDPTRVKALFYRALSHAQAGRKAEAVADYDEILRLSPPDAPWLDAVRADRAVMLGEAPPAVATDEAPGPDAAAVAAAADMSAEEQASMIAGMVDGLAQRLKDDPNDPAGWERLIRAYGVMGRAEDARAAFETASSTFAGAPDVLERIRQVATEAGVVAD